MALEYDFTTAGEAKTDEAAVNKGGQPHQAVQDLPVAVIIESLGW